MSNNFTANIQPSVGLPPIGNNPRNRPPTEGPAVVRSIPGRTQYNSDTKEVEKVGDYADTNPIYDFQQDKEAVRIETAKPKTKKPVQPEEVEVEAKAEETAEEKADRHAKWKQAQADKKEAANQQKTVKQIEQQRLAKDYLKEGNIVKAADALGLTVTEMLSLTQNAALSIPTKDKELTPEEKKAKEEADFRAAWEAEKTENQRYRYETTARDYIRENIVPVMKDEEKYQLLNQNKDNIPKIQRVVYEYLNNCYQETCEYDSSGKLVKDGVTPDIADVLDTMESYYETQAKTALEQFRGVKKFSDMFAAQEEEQKDKVDAARRTVSSKPTKTAKKPQVPANDQAFVEEEALLGEKQSQIDEDYPEIEEEAHQALSVKQFNPRARNKKPFALMSPEEKVAFLRAQK
jgi:hypothetical protein